MISFLNVETLLYEGYVHSLIDIGQDSTGVALKSIILKYRYVLNEDIIKKNFLGFATDGASNMRSNGDLSLTSQIIKDMPYSWHIHDISHCLHLAYKYALATLPKKIINFLHTIPSK